MQDDLKERLRRKTLYRPNEWQLANPNGPEAAARIEALEADNARLMGLVENLAGAEASYRIAHDLHGGGSLQSGCAWDRMRRAGDAARSTLAKIKEATDAE